MGLIVSTFKIGKSRDRKSTVLAQMKSQRLDSTCIVLTWELCLLCTIRGEWKGAFPPLSFLGVSSSIFQTFGIPVFALICIAYVKCILLIKLQIAQDAWQHPWPRRFSFSPGLHIETSKLQGLLHDVKGGWCWKKGTCWKSWALY